MIILDHILPHPLSTRKLDASDVWNRSLELDFNSNYHVVAPSGSGKSTLIGVLYGLRTDFSGRLDLGQMGTDFSSVRKNIISVVLQDMRLLNEYTVMENIQLKNQIHSHLSLNRIQEMLKQLGVDQLMDTKVAQLSEGEKQRVAIIRALCMPFKFLLLDEPFSHLDDQNARRAAQLILEEANKNSAGLLMANLRTDDFFPYDKYLVL